MHDRLLRRRQVEEITGMSRSSIYRLMQDGQFPRPVKVGNRRRQVEGQRHRRLGGVTARQRARPERPRWSEPAIGVYWPGFPSGEPVR